MTRLQCRTDPTSSLVAGNKRSDHVTTGGAIEFREREQSGQDRDGGVSRHRHIDVVVIECMRRCAIDKRGRRYRQTRRVADNARLRRAAALR
jgi:hypothetical protein